MKKSILALTILAVTAGNSFVANSEESEAAATKVSATETTAVEAPVERTAETEKQALQLLFDNHFKATLDMSPIYGTYIGLTEYNDKFSAPISKESLAAELALEEDYLAQINNIDESLLSGQDLLSYQIFKRDREMAIKGAKFPSYLIPLNQMYGIHNSFATLGSGESAQPFKTVKDYDNFIKRSQGYVAYMDSVIVSMREGIKQGVVLPKPIVEKILPQLSAHVVKNAKDSVFYGPVNMLADNQDISASDKKKITKKYNDLILKTLAPSYKKFHDFIKNEYLAKARSTVGLSDLPNGKAWYEHQIEVNTTLALTADEIHKFGQEEVARILKEMKQVKETVKFEGDLPAFFEFLKNDEQFYWKTEEEVVKAYTDVKAKIEKSLPDLFEVFPKADYEVKPVEAFRAASSAGASYQSPAPDGSRPGVFYINTHNLKAQPKFLLETLSIHEAAPGHHFQITIQQEVEGLPMFRKFGGYTVFSEGWALYAESLGKEMGMFEDPYQWYGRLSDEQLRAMRLVVDTGLHAFGWTREQAIQYMIDNSSMAESDITAEVERYISIPGQAVSYKIGQREIRSLRNKASRALGQHFDIKKFHTQILIDGALPMPILEQKIDKWIDSQAYLNMEE
ncbi:DUF885 domain-containing protein [Thalassomonas sp. M1454]|uniref:DUF885 domain-containing protein n=1 Tax=Thalassomonas sp. M1454 TaxID=2594477 RepID=UPI00117C6C89|nr:DUF885 domain-containing protein [Thalassomonas sp. M1454]TRX53965.1 DUF885 domain-containing protein [Thalassomonas sp. M1454]